MNKTTLRHFDTSTLRHFDTSTLRHAVLSNLILYLGLLVPHLIFDLCINPYTWVTDQRIYTSDQLIFEIIGKAWANGIPAYTYYFDHKGPFLFLWFMIGYKLAGTYAGVTVLNAFWNTISSVMLYKIIYKLNWFKTEKGNRRNALASTLLLFVCQYVITANMTILVTNVSMPFLLACVLLLMHWHETDTFLTCDWKHAVYAENISRSNQSQSKDWLIFFRQAIFYMKIELGWDWALSGRSMVHRTFSG